MNVRCLLFPILLTWISLIDAALKEGECEVCINVVKRLEKEMEQQKISGEKEVHALIRRMCSEIKENKENRFCYYIGGTEDAATGMLKKLSTPLMSFYPPEKICENLKKLDMQICELKYEKPLDWKNINLKKMRVKELKRILSNWGEECRGCVEKQEYIQRIEELKKVYVREEL